MAIKLKVIRAGDFLILDSDGKFDFTSSKELLVNIALAKKPPADFEVLLDFRDATFDLSTTEIWYLAKELDSHREAFKEKLAILVSEKSAFDRAVFFETCANNRGFQVDTFSSFEEAIEWLYPSQEYSPQ